ncbi:bifunctional UDP-N-acetylglucosamine diphosphorylase/glucosamine-1-phosphate N-acetyltransferase GlmU [Evansella sp. AB-P1]|uniref:bifunctional UDP-N-acetylglucosamine diphosphorylase/glucosamine-1-phosphate N-acetyltransferase GlmU n=1 Tax=Evansella sp. AB-P1 TaxID=3037653 RepID=UPI00241F8CD1|nr:bifunctional UDP-N-acetylglucosamine diphosphorylase/glucosamine-1-phosphate N-acetyltransferase GlmU [Evansella sp. AB-P1]MDG5789980.1 bifunctional UDP-N-acetylglucosamine diphosphorylase/glucosamine-1-phosphate N-acetyltransferase GlmU [Evansella sp. AB-P1]
MNNRYAVILAAGKGTRMKSDLYKVLHQVCGKPMVQHIVDQLKGCQVDKAITVVGHGAEKVKEQLGADVSYVLQEEQLGTGHAVLQAEPMLGNQNGTTIVVCGDTPLLTSETMNSLIEEHESKNAKATILTALASDPTGYGRILRSHEDGTVKKIVEHKDASEEERLVKEINTGTYCFDNQALFQALKNVGNDNVQGEYYLPDVIEILQEQGKIIAAFQTPLFSETIGVNDRVALSQAEKVMKNRINERLMRDGVTLIDPDNTYVSSDAKVGRDTIIYPGTIIKGETIIGELCEVGPHSEIENSKIGNNTLIKQSVVHDSDVGDFVSIGPFSHLRPKTQLNDHVRVGNFVELKKTSMGEGSKASHLSYLGDAEIGNGVNVGCGSITVNYDGKNKYLTKIEDGAFIGCNSNLIAPVTIGKEAFIAAGSTITDDVPSESLAIARQRQTTKEGYTKKKNIGK